MSQHKDKMVKNSGMRLSTSQRAITAENDPGMRYSPNDPGMRYSLIDLGMRRSPPQIMTPPESPRASARSYVSNSDASSFAGTPQAFFTKRGDHLDWPSENYRTRQSSDNLDHSPPLMHYHRPLPDALHHALQPLRKPVHAVTEHEMMREELHELRRELSNLALHTKETNMILMDFNLSLEDIKAALSLAK